MKSESGNIPNIDSISARDFFERQGWIIDGTYTDEGLQGLADLIELLPTVQQGKWGAAFVPLMSRMVPTSIELIIVRDKQVLLTHRQDKYYQGWHVPGSHIDPKESLQDAASRTAITELGCDVEVIGEPLVSLYKRDDSRFAFTSHLVHCKPVGEPGVGQWFSSMPTDIIPVHRQYWTYIEKLLR